MPDPQPPQSPQSPQSPASYEILIVEEQVVFTLAELCRACGAEAGEVHALVVEGLLEPEGAAPDDWRFGGHSLRHARTALRLAHELDISFGAAGIVMDLLDEIGSLRARLARLENR
ncbi:MAG TPA: chaperone modulator CbpM [Burkholderiaceae bacterium]